MSLARWAIFIAVLLIFPAAVIGAAAALGWISLPFTYATALAIFGAYAGWAAFLHYAKLREFLQEVDWGKANTDGKSHFSSRRYRQHLIHRHRFFDVKGLSTQGIYTLELERVFVDLTIAPRAVHQVTTDPIQLLPEEARRGQSIWSYLSLESLTNQNMVIIGPPGCGKTTLLKHMTLTLVAGRKQRRKWNAPNKLPILLFLRDHAQAIQENPNLSLPEAVCGALAGWNLHAPASWFESRLEHGRFLVMLDGLDEVADPEARCQVVAWVQRQMEACGGNRFIVTSRPYGYYDHRLSGVAVLQVSPFTREQVERFVQNWYIANEIMSAQKDDAGIRQDAAKGASDLLQRLHNTSDLADLAVNPLLLTMIATVHRYRSSLPGRRVELYKEICDVFLGQRRQARGLAMDLTPAQKQEVLQPLAYHLMCQRGREVSLDEAASVITGPLAQVSPSITAEDFLKGVEDESGLLLERESGVYAFAHKTFQEYLTSAHVLGDEELEAELAGRVGQDWWHETIRLYTAQTDASPFIEACLTGDPPAIPALILAIECREEALKLEPAVRTRIEKVLTDGVENPDPERWHPIAEALLALRLQRMIRVDEDRYVDNTLVTHAEYQLFLDEKYSQEEYYQPDHWMSYRFPVGQGREPVVGVRASDAAAFCDWLTSREAGEWHYRLPHDGESQMSAVEVASGVASWVQTAQGFECPLPGDGPVILNRQLAQQLADDLDRTSQRALNLARHLVRDLERAGRLTNSLIYSLVRDRDSKLSHALDPNSARGIYDAYICEYTRVHALADDINRAWELAHDIAYRLTYADDIDHRLEYFAPLLDIEFPISHLCNIARTRARDITQARNLNIARGLDIAFNRAEDLERDFELVRDIAQARNLNTALERNLQLDRALELDRTLKPIPEFDRALKPILELALDRGRLSAPTTSSQEERSEGLRQQVRLRTLWLAAILSDQVAKESKAWVPRLVPGGSGKANEYELQHLADAYLDLFVDFCILEARIAGELPAFEGIRLVRERQPRQ